MRSEVFEVKKEKLRRFSQFLPEGTCTPLPVRQAGWRRRACPKRRSFFRGTLLPDTSGQADAGALRRLELCFTPLKSPLFTAQSFGIWKFRSLHPELPSLQHREQSGHVRFFSQIQLLVFDNLAQFGRVAEVFKHGFAV